jgi:hypothetical protein
MTSAPATRRAFLVAAASVALTCAVIARAGGPEHSGRPPSPSGRDVSSEGRLTSEPASSQHSEGRAELSARTATRVARRFAAVVGRWDAGRRSAHLAARLRALCSPALWQRLRARPHAPLSQRPSDVARVDGALLATDDGRWRAAITTGPPRYLFLATAVVAPTTAGPRVTDLLP